MICRIHTSINVLVILLASLTVFSESTKAADNWAQFNPFNAIPAPKWPEWATVNMPDVDLVPDWVKVPDIREIPGDIARLHNRNIHMLGKAVDFINPFKTNEIRQPVPPPTGSRKTRNVSNSSTSRFWFPSFMQEERKPIGPSRSVSEFLDRPRIR